MASEEKISKSNDFSTSRASQRRALDANKAKFVLCIATGGNIDLVLRKVYPVKADRKSARLGLVRVVDESGDDYLYPADFFVPIRLPRGAARVVQAIS